MAETTFNSGRARSPLPILDRKRCNTPASTNEADKKRAITDRETRYRKDHLLS